MLQLVGTSRLLERCLRRVAEFYRSSTLISLLLIAFVIVALPACGITGFGARSHYPSKPVYHQVSNGDTLWSISRRYGVSLESVALLNGVHDPGELRVGQRLLIGYRHGGYISSSPSVTPVRGQGNFNYRGGRLRWPLGKGRLVSRFGPRGRSFHDGIDIAAPRGTPVYAAHSGMVVYADNGLRGYGNLVIIRGDDALNTVYGHNYRLLVHRGQRVAKGQKISLVGSTGRSSGPHLHFEVRMKDRRGRFIAVDPIPFLRSKDRRTPPRYRVNESLTPILARAR